MENASKALIMAAGVLIGIMILSLAVYLFATFGATSAELHGQVETSRITQFNTQFTSYEGRSNITIYDVISAVNLAKDSNEYYELTDSTDSNYYIIVSLQGVNSRLEKASESTLNSLIAEDLKEENLVKADWDGDGTIYGKLRTYTCNVVINENTQLVKQVTFKRN